MTIFEKYPEYQATQYPWIGDLPNSWNVRRLKEVGRLFGGAGFPHEYQNVQGEELYFYKVGDLSLSENGKTLLASPHTISKETARVLRATIVPKSAIVYAKIGAALLLNRRRMTAAACCIDNNMTAYVTEAEEVTPEWAFYWLSTIDFGEHVNPGAVPSFSEGYQSVLPIPVPPVEEQKVIARFLDFKTAQIDALIAKKKALLNKLAEKRTALISHAVTKGLDPSVPMKDSEVVWLGNVPAHWKVIPIKFSLDMPITDGPHSTPQFHDDGIPFISAEAVKNDRLDFSKKRGYISEDDHAIFSKKYKPKYGDVYMVKSGATTGAVARVETHEEFNIWSPLAVLRPHAEKSITDYLFYVLKSKPFFYSVELSWSYGTQQNIGMGVISNIRMALPPIEEQKEICLYLEPLLQKIEDQRAKVDSVVERLQEYRSALITNAVTGKIDVRGFEAPQPAEGIAS